MNKAEILSDEVTKPHVQANCFTCKDNTDTNICKMYV